MISIGFFGVLKIKYKIICIANIYYYLWIKKSKKIIMTTLQTKIKNLNTPMLIDTFKGLANNNTEEASVVNDFVMSELEFRLSESDFINLLDEVYED